MTRQKLFSVTEKDFRMDTFRSGGKGGQHQNTTNSGVRFTHIDSGAVGEARDERSQAQNKRLAFQRCVNNPIFQAWLRRKSTAVMGKTAEIEHQVERAMQPHNLRVETRESGKWEEAGE